MDGDDERCVYVAVDRRIGKLMGLMIGMERRDLFTDMRVVIRR